MTKYKYERLDENYKIQFCPVNDYDGKLSGTGNCIIGLKMWFDENPEERKRLGWIKHYYIDTPKELQEILPEYDPAIHYLVKGTKTIDPYTIEDEYHLIEKTEEFMVLEEMLEVMNLYVPNGTMIVDSQGGALL